MLIILYVVQMQEHTTSYGSQFKKTHLGAFVAAAPPLHTLPLLHHLHHLHLDPHLHYLWNSISGSSALFLRRAPPSYKDDLDNQS